MDNTHDSDEGFEVRSNFRAVYLALLEQGQRPTVRKLADMVGGARARVMMEYHALNREYGIGPTG